MKPYIIKAKKGYETGGGNLSVKPELNNVNKGTYAKGVIPNQNPKLGEKGKPVPYHNYLDDGKKKIKPTQGRVNNPSEAQVKDKKLVDKAALELMEQKKMNPKSYTQNRGFKSGAKKVMKFDGGTSKVKVRKVVTEKKTVADPDKDTYNYNRGTIQRQENGKGVSFKEDKKGIIDPKSRVKEDPHKKNVRDSLDKSMTHEEMKKRVGSNSHADVTYKNKKGEEEYAGRIVKTPGKKEVEETKMEVSKNYKINPGKIIGGKKTQVGYSTITPKTSRVITKGDSLAKSEVPVHKDTNSEHQKKKKMETKKKGTFKISVK